MGQKQGGRCEQQEQIYLQHRTFQSHGKYHWVISTDSPKRVAFIHSIFKPFVGIRAVE